MWVEDFCYHHNGMQWCYTEEFEPNKAVETRLQDCTHLWHQDGWPDGRDVLGLIRTPNGVMLWYGRMSGSNPTIYVYQDVYRQLRSVVAAHYREKSLLAWCYLDDLATYILPVLAETRRDAASTLPSPLAPRP
jgi:hypothetical protein